MDGEWKLAIKVGSLVQRYSLMLVLRRTLFAFLHVRLEGFSACRDSQVSTSV